MAGTDAAGVAGTEDEVAAPNKGWASVWGFFDGLRGVTSRVGGIADDVGQVGAAIADTKRDFWELSRDKQIAATDDVLTRAGWERGDNIQKYYVIGAVALAGVAILTMR